MKKNLPFLGMSSWPNSVLGRVLGMSNWDETCVLSFLEFSWCETRNSLSSRLKKKNGQETSLKRMRKWVIGFKTDRGIGCFHFGYNFHILQVDAYRNSPLATALIRCEAFEYKIKRKDQHLKVMGLEKMVETTHQNKFG